jgi:hypothetical protein
LTDWLGAVSFILNTSITPFKSLLHETNCVYGEYDLRSPKKDAFWNWNPGLNYYKRLEQLKLIASGCFIVVAVTI